MASAVVCTVTQAFLAVAVVIGVAGYAATEVLNASTRPAPEPMPTVNQDVARPTLPCDWTPTAAPTDTAPHTVVAVACDPSLKK
ncbi:hypothetical protein ACWD1W_28045 [Streptomyces olivaceoviridis]